jgi:Undecaprenyl-phosphate glucose phosphotransferase
MAGTTMRVGFQARAHDGILPKRVLSFSSRVLPGLIVGLDSVVVLAVALVSFFGLVGTQFIEVGHYAAAICFVWIVAILLMNFAGLYQLEPIMRPFQFADKILITFGTTFLFLFAAAFSLKISTSFSRVWISAFAVGACGGTLLCRCLASCIVRQLTDRRFFTRNVIIAGAGDQARCLVEHIGGAPPRFITVLGVFAERQPSVGAHLGPYPLLGSLESLPSYVRDNNVDDVIIALPWSADEPIKRLVAMLRELPVNVYLSSDLIGFQLPFRSCPDHFGSTPLVEVIGRPLEGWGVLRKAALDYGLGIVLTALMLPVMAAIALAIKLDSRGPVFFRQERYGFVNRVFWIWKFRTMRHGAATPTTLQATRNDARVTRMGRFLRRTSLDELPQLFNVLNGTMSLVGPRPHAVDHNEEYSKLIRGYFARHRVKPGITGWAQVNGFRGETETVDKMEARVRYDIHYVENWTLLLDVKILATTVLAILRGRNAY